MPVVIEHRGDEAVVVAGGRLCASQSGTLRRELLRVFEQGNRVCLELRDVEEADLTLLQLLCAAHHTATARGVEFALGGLASADAVLRLIHGAGAWRGAGCPERCLWADAPACRAADEGIPGID